MLPCFLFLWYAQKDLCAYTHVNLAVLQNKSPAVKWIDHMKLPSCSRGSLSRAARQSWGHDAFQDLDTAGPLVLRSPRIWLLPPFTSCLLHESLGTSSNPGYQHAQGVTATVLFLLKWTYLGSVVYCLPSTHEANNFFSFQKWWTCGRQHESPLQ